MPQGVRIVLPDADAVMAPAQSLFVNDADWLPAGTARLVHAAIKVATAEALGARSLRFHHQVCHWWTCFLCFRAWCMPQSHIQKAEALGAQSLR